MTPLLSAPRFGSPQEIDLGWPGTWFTYVSSPLFPLNLPSDCITEGRFVALIIKSQLLRILAR